MASIRPRSRRRPRVAVVLSGGGNLGAIQVGQLKALVERGIRPDLVLGCSIGALNGVAFAADPTIQGVATLEAIWREMQAEPDALMPGSWVPNPVTLVRKGQALHPSDGLRRTIFRFLGDRRFFEELEVAFQCVATDVDATTETWFEGGELVEPILASAALPAVYPMVTIAGRRYLDGGVLNNVPISRAAELGARKIYVLHVGLHGKPNPTVKRPIDAALVAYWIARNGRFARDLASVPSSIETVVLPPGQRPELRFDDFTRTDELIEQGYDNAVRYLDDLEAEGDDASARSDRLRADARRVIDELRGKVGARWSGHGPRPRSADSGESSAGTIEGDELSAAMLASATLASDEGEADGDAPGVRPGSGGEGAGESR